MVVLQLLHVLPKRHKHITLSWTFVCIHFLLNAGFAKTFVQGTNVKKSYWEILSGFLCQSCTGVNLDEILPALQFFLWFCPFYLTPHSWVLGESTMAKVPCIYMEPDAPGVLEAWGGLYLVRGIGKHESRCVLLPRRHHHGARGFKTLLGPQAYTSDVLHVYYEYRVIIRHLFLSRLKHELLGYALWVGYQ